MAKIEQRYPGAHGGDRLYVVAMRGALSEDVRATLRWHAEVNAPRWKRTKQNSFSVARTAALEREMTRLAHERT